jgi:hypothetical protein
MRGYFFEDYEIKAVPTFRMCTYGLHNCLRWRVILKWAFEGWRTGGFCFKIRASSFNEGLLWLIVPLDRQYTYFFLLAFLRFLKLKCESVSGEIKEFLLDLESGY